MRININEKITSLIKLLSIDDSSSMVDKIKPGVSIITPADQLYEESRLIYNRMHDCYPAVIIRTLDIDSIRVIMRFAFENDIVLAIRGGGHHIGGFSTCNDGIVLDFSTFKNIEIDSVNNIVSVDPGVTLGDLDKKLADNGYIVPTGTISQTGVAGLTLGGGIGWLIGKYGLTCDQLCGADVLLANGELVRAEDDKHKKLLWALRGGGGNFGIVLKFRYRLNPLPKTICGMGVVAYENIAEVSSKLINHLNNCPNSLTVAPILVKDQANNISLRIDFCCANGMQTDVDNLINISDKISWSEVREWDFPSWQKEFDDSLMPPMRGYWKAIYLDKISDNIIDRLLAAFELSPVKRCTIMIEHLHGAFKAFSSNESAFPLRKSNFGIVIAARWLDKDEDAQNIMWVRNTFSAIDPHGLSQTYLNYTTADDDRAVRTLLSESKSQISDVKSLYDPFNKFKKNHNILPSTEKIEEQNV